MLFSDSRLYQSPRSLRTRRRTCAVPRRTLFCSSISLIVSGIWASQPGNLSAIAPSSAPTTTTGVTMIHHVLAQFSMTDSSSSTLQCLSVKGSVSRQNYYYLDGRRLENVNFHPYLRVELAYNLKWSWHIIENIVAKASGRLGLLRRALKLSDSRTKQQAYNTIVRPILEYGCSVRDPCLAKDIKMLEKVQNRVLRFIFNLRNQVNFFDNKI